MSLPAHPKRLSVTLTNSSLRCGVPRSQSNCPIAQELQNKYPDLFPDPRVTTLYVSGGISGTLYPIYYLSENAAKFVKKYDAGNITYLSRPITFRFTRDKIHRCANCG